MNAGAPGPTPSLSDLERRRGIPQFDWMLPNEAFDRAVHEHLRRHFPELTDEARNVIAGNYSYSHAK